MQGGGTLLMQMFQNGLPTMCLNISKYHINVCNQPKLSINTNVLGLVHKSYCFNPYDVCH